VVYINRHHHITVCTEMKEAVPGNLVMALKLPPSFLGRGSIPLQAYVNKTKALQKRETGVLYKTTG
jgi:hypothetical protein